MATRRSVVLSPCLAAGEPLREIALSYAGDHSTISRLKAQHAVEV